MSDLSGWLTKKGGFIPTWKKRWFSLEGNQLSYTKTPGLDSLGVIVLEKDYEVGVDSDPKKPFLFYIQTKDRKYFIQANSEEEMNQWINGISNAIHGNNVSHVDLLNLFTKFRIIGHSLSGPVFLTFKQENETNNLYVCKQYLKSELIEADLHSNTADNPLLSIVGPNLLVQTKYILDDENHYYCFSEFLDGIPLVDHLYKNAIPDAKTIFSIAIQLIISLIHYHAKNIFYIDLHPSNIMIDKTGYIRLCPPCPFKRKNLNENPYKNYIAPSILEGKPPSESTDLYSLGVIIYELACCEQYNPEYGFVFPQRIDQNIVILVKYLTAGNGLNAEAVDLPCFGRPSIYDISIMSPEGQHLDPVDVDNNELYLNEFLSMEESILSQQPNSYIFPQELSNY